jgi:hypothetical protein
MTTEGLNTELSATYDAMRSAAGTPRYYQLKATAREIREVIYDRVGQELKSSSSRAAR